MDPSAIAIATADHSQQQQHHLAVFPIYPSSLPGIGFGLGVGEFYGFHIPARIRGDEEEHDVLTEQELTTFMSPPSATTFLAFHPQDNNIIAIGMDDSSIQIYNVRVDEVKTKLKGHQKRITGFSFSNALNVLLSSEPTLK
ncbi:Topless-related protein 4 [Abeliophyllum distichum]|uniref:Topless-related protein 4 n=1 Tax=Abeliophyllum distichum TaxID=126358 RepID=A0ABD1PNB8_9LAMI